MRNKPRLPKEGEFVRHHGTLVRIEEIPPEPVPPKKEYIFEAITARCELRLNGETLQEIATYTDFYGYETSLEAAIEEMKAWAAKRNLKAASDLEVVVIRVATQYRSTPRNRENFYDDEFFDFHQKDWGSQHGLPETEKIVWSSKTEEN